MRKQASEIRSLKEKLQRHFHDRDISLDDQAHEGLRQLMDAYRCAATKGKDDESFQAIFWSSNCKLYLLKQKRQFDGIH